VRPSHVSTIDSFPFSRNLCRYWRNRTASADAGEALERIGGNTSKNAAQAVDRIGETADRVADTVATALSTMAERFRGGASSMSDQAGKMGNEAAKLGNDALQRLSREVEHRPLVTLAVAVGVGILIGVASRRH
jgi:ElaB/YqjD/DUF883 family membrane-anchored ribosome-binding protein